MKMGLGKRLLRLISPHEEDLRQQMRHTMACAEAHTEDLHRTVVMDGEAIRAAIWKHMADPEKTIPGVQQ